MRVSIFAFSRQGCGIARRVRDCFGETDVSAMYTMERFGEAAFSTLPHPAGAFYGQRFAQSDALIFVGACGIAVRAIAPYVRDKRSDPAVLCVDELGRFVIPLLSGHVGGANALARRLAEAMGAVPVVTTATDVHGRFSVDTWARAQGLQADHPDTMKTIAAAILEADIPFCSDVPVLGEWPTGLVPGTRGELGICVSWERKAPFQTTLRLIPRALHLGLGCKKGVGEADVDRAVQRALDAANLDFRAVCHAGTIARKAEETGLVHYCRNQGWPLDFYSAEQLQRVPGIFSRSDFVEKITGVDNVCERAALVDAAELIVKKTVTDGVTVAVAAEQVEVRFGDTSDCGHWPG